MKRRNGTTVFKIEVEGLNELVDGFKKAPESTVNELQKAISSSIYLIRPIMKNEAPYKSGKLRDNIMAVSQGLRAVVGPNLNVTPYAYWVHEGTDPYIIRPKTMGYSGHPGGLYWEQGSSPPAKHVWNKVQHPGIAPNPFVDRTFKQIKNPVQTIFRNAVQKIINNIVK